MEILKPIPEQSEGMNVQSCHATQSHAVDHRLAESRAVLQSLWGNRPDQATTKPASEEDRNR